MSLTETIIDSQPAKFGLWPSVWRLIILRVRVWWNGFKRAKIGAKIGAVLLALVVIGLMVGLFWFSSFLLRFINSPELAAYIDPSAFIEAIPTMVLTGAFAITIMTNFGVLLQSLYLSRDMSFLVTSPLPMRAVFLAKLLEAILPTYTLFCAISLPVLFGLGAANGYSLWYYPLLLVVLGLLTLAAGGLASILVMAVVRVAPARRVAEVLGFIGALSSILCGQSGNLMGAAGVGEAQIGGALSIFTRLNSPWSPLAWAGQGLSAIGRGDWLPGLGLSLLSLGLAGGIFAGTLWLAEQLYYTGWASMQGSLRKKRARPLESQAGRSLSQAAKPARALLPGPVRAVVVKDLLMLRRDPRSLSNLITPLILGLVMIFTTRSGGEKAGEALSGFGLEHLEMYGLLLLAVFVGWMLMFNLATMAFTREGRYYWLIKVAPLRAWQLVLAKFIVSYLPTLAFCLVYLLLGFAIQGIDWVYLPYNFTVIALCMAGATGLSLSYAISGANLDWEHINRQKLKGSAGCTSLIFISLYLLVDLVLFLLPPGLWQIFSGETPLLAYLLSLALGGAGALSGGLIPLWLTMPKLAHIGES